MARRLNNKNQIIKWNSFQIKTKEIKWYISLSNNLKIHMQMKTFQDDLILKTKNGFNKINKL